MSQRIFPVTMPKWGIEMQQGTITEWHVAAGDPVRKGDHMLDVETEKIVNSIEAPAGGTVRKITADKGSPKNVGALIAVLADPSVSESEVDEFIRSFKPAEALFELDGAKPGGAEAGETTPSVPSPRLESEPAIELQSRAEARISPFARRAAERLGVDLTKITGTGRDGRVSKEDVEAYAAARSTRMAREAAPRREATPAREKLTPMRATIARRLLESTQGIPHYRLAIEVEFGALLAHRTSLNAAGGALSINDLLVRATALSLIQHPALNSQLIGDEVLTYNHADICVAVATDSGLVAPIVRGAENKTSAQIGVELKELAARARSGTLTREEISGGTFSISNLGMFGVDRFDAIINPPQTAILAVGSAADRVIARSGSPVVTKIATLTLSADHRVIDGATGAKFLAALKSLIESPESL